MAAVTSLLSTSITVEKLILLALNTVQAGLSAYKVTQVNNPFEYTVGIIRETNKGALRTVYALNGNEISAEKAYEDLGREKIICVKRCCCSLTGWFPSGVLTVATWTVAGTAVRHEFIILHTTNFVILIEIGSKKEGSKTNVIIKTARSKEEKKEAEKELLQKKWYVRTMKQVEGIELGLLQFHQIISLVALWILVNRAGDCNYTVIQKNCKSLARSILYFSKKSTDYWDVLYSIWGIFTDKPLNIFYHVDMILLEKAAVKSAYAFSSKMKGLVEDIITLLEKMRTCQLDREDIESQ